MELDDELLKLYIIIYGFTYNDVRNDLIQYNLINDTEGYIYCIKNSLYDVYNIEIFKLGNSHDLEERFSHYNNIYFENIEIIKELYVPYKYTYEYLLFVSLRNERIKSNREFFTNLNSIESEFKILENILKNSKLNNTEKLKKYLIHILKKISIENIMELEIPKNIIINIVNRREIKYIIVPKKEKINITYKKDSGFIHLLKIEEIDYNFENKIQYINVSNKKKISSMTEFLFSIKEKKKIQISNIHIAKILLKDMMNNKLIKNNYYECDEKFAIEIMNKIKEYFDNHKEDEIIKAYLNDMYKIGEKVIPSKFIITDKNKYGYSRKDIHKRLMEMIDNDEDIEAEIINDDLKKSLNKNNIVIKNNSKKKNKSLFVDTKY